jgi:hypothetical protein
MGKVGHGAVLAYIITVGGRRVVDPQVHSRSPPTDLHRKGREIRLDGSSI